MPLPMLVFGGPYSNLQAVEALMAQARLLAIPPERIVCTGDVVAYCGHPEETVAAIRAWGIHVIQGNCEEQLAAAADDCGCGFDEGSTCDRLAKSWYEFANARLSSESRRWMGSLPRQLDLSLAGSRVRVVHGGVERINRFLFASQRDELAAELESSGADIVLAGHCGIPFLRQIVGRVWFNPGVIGMPANDGTPRVWYGLVEKPVEPNEEKNLRFSLHPLSYDHEKATAAVRAGGYADPYAEALSTGRWPSLDVLPATERAMSGCPLAPRSQDVGTRTTERVG
jgi:predicted phosphodiesterase